MRLILDIQSGPAAGQTAEVSQNRPFYVGRAETAHLAIPDDSQLEDVHFVLECRKPSWLLRDMDTRNRTIVNGRKVSETELRPGDTIVAGQSTFVVRIEEGAAAPLPVTPVPASAPVAVARPVPAASAPAPSLAPARPGEVGSRPLLEILKEQPEPLYAILDAARDPMIYLLLQGCQEEHQSLYEGPKGEELALVAPYLVRLPPGSPFLTMLIELGWGKSWGVYLTSPAPFPEVRKHLRRFIIVELEGKGKAYFRFYDPRVLRLYLPTCTAEELTMFFGPIRTWGCESPKGDFYVSSSRTEQGLRQQQLALAQQVSARLIR